MLLVIRNDITQKAYIHFCKKHTNSLIRNIIKHDHDNTKSTHDYTLTFDTNSQFPDEFSRSSSGNWECVWCISSGDRLARKWKSLQRAHLEPNNWQGGGGLTLSNDSGMTQEQLEWLRSSWSDSGTVGVTQEQLEWLRSSWSDSGAAGVTGVFVNMK